MRSLPRIKKANGSVSVLCPVLCDAASGTGQSEAVPTLRPASLWLILVPHFWLMHHVVDLCLKIIPGTFPFCLLSADGFMGDWFHLAFLNSLSICLLWPSAILGHLLMLSSSTRRLKDSISNMGSRAPCLPSLSSLSLSPKLASTTWILRLSPKFSLVCWTLSWYLKLHLWEFNRPFLLNATPPPSILLLLY